MEMENALSLSLCYNLGKSIRYGDADSFLQIYDSLLEGRDSVLQLTTLKEVARQISELPQDDFVLLENTISHTSAHSDPAIILSTVEPVAIQLTTLIEKLRMDTEATEVTSCTSDSGAVSDYDGSLISEITESEILLASSSSTTTLCSASSDIVCPGINSEAEKQEQWGKVWGKSKSIVKELMDVNSSQAPVQICELQDTKDSLLDKKQSKIIRVEDLERELLVVNKESESRADSQAQDGATRELGPRRRVKQKREIKRTLRNQNWKNKTNLRSQLHTRDSQLIDSPGKDANRQRETHIPYDEGHNNHRELVEFLWEGWQKVQQEMKSEV